MRVVFIVRACSNLAVVVNLYDARSGQGGKLSFGDREKTERDASWEASRSGGCYLSMGRLSSSCSRFMTAAALSVL